MEPLTFIIIIGFSWLSLSAITRLHWFEVKNPEIGLGYAFYRTKKLNNIINLLARRGQSIWKIIWDVGVISGLGILIVGLTIFTLNIPLFFIETPEGANGPIAVTPVIPGITVSFQSLPYFLVAVMIGAIAHEFAHGIAARVENIDLKSTGIFVFLAFFGAFVEPDEKSFNEKSRRSKVRVMAAGALANMIVAGIFMLLLIIPLAFPLIISPLYQSEPSGALIIETIPDFPASQAGIKAGYAIIAINTSDGFHQIASSLDFHDYSSSSILPSQNLTFYFADDVNPISLITVPREDNASKGFIGIRTWEYFAPHASSSILFLNLIPYWLFNTILYVFMINLMFAIMNLLPVPFLDGDKLLTSFLGPRFEKRIKWIRYFALGVLGLNIILSLAFMGWQQI
ncbi:MAG: site-2 protease family protein [Candidatus Hodarchaeales archaeon]|jgi:membrane-associated protease RseP (regulator of RpoE activity)